MDTHEIKLLTCDYCEANDPQNAYRSKHKSAISRHRKTSCPYRPNNSTSTDNQVQQCCFCEKKFKISRMDNFKRHVASHKNVVGVVIDTNKENVILPQNDNRFVAQKEKIKNDHFQLVQLQNESKNVSRKLRRAKDKITLDKIDLAVLDEIGCQIGPARQRYV